MKVFKELIKELYLGATAQDQYQLREKAKNSKYLLLMNAKDIEFHPKSQGLEDFIVLAFSDSLDYTEDNLNKCCKESLRLILVIEGDSVYSKLNFDSNLLWVDADFILSLPYTKFTEKDALLAECELTNTPPAYREWQLNFHSKLFSHVRDGYGVYLDGGWLEGGKDSFEKLYTLKCLSEEESRKVFSIDNGVSIVCYLVDVEECEEDGLFIQSKFLWEKMIKDLVKYSEVGYLLNEDKVEDLNQLF